MRRIGKRQRQPTLDLRRGWLSLFLSIAIVGIGGVLLWASPFGQSIERQFGLEFAFWLRGDRQAPGDAIYVPVDQVSADRLCDVSSSDALSRKRKCSVDRLEDWARPHFARLVDVLADAGASVIVFDVNFFETGGNADTLLADAFDRAGNVLLLSWVAQGVREPVPGIVTRGNQLEPPAGLFANTAIATAPMPLPKGARHDRYHTFVPVAGRIVPTIPVVALFMYQKTPMATGRCRPLTGSDGTANPAEFLERLRGALPPTPTGDRPGVGGAECVDQLSGALKRTVASHPVRFFNFYEGLGTFRGPPLHTLVGAGAEPDPATFDGKVVFVGVDDRANLDADDSFTTAVEDRDFSGVELNTTAFVNLLHGHDVRPTSPINGVFLLFALVIAAGLAFLLPARVAVAAVAILAAVFAAMSWYRFDRDNLLLPIIIPLFVQMPAMVALGWRWQMGELEHVTDVLKRFVPSWVKSHVSHHKSISHEAERLFGVCMHTDVAGYTALSEKLASDPLALKGLEREYWALIDAEIAREQGERLEISGDGMLSIWTAPGPDSETATRACRAALAIHRVIDAFNERHPDTPFHTRIGIHAGEVALGLVGGSDRYTLTVGGDVANTAARIESDLNKLLGTRLLVSELVADLSTAMRTRRIGSFVLRGKSLSVTVYELSEFTG